MASLIEFGCGDGNQLKISAYRNYIGVDVSRTAVEVFRKLFDKDCSKRFMTTKDYSGEQADLALSLEVIYHLVEQQVYGKYMRDLFAAGRRFVVIYAFEDIPVGMKLEAHVKNWKFGSWICENERSWELVEQIKNEHPFEGDTVTGSLADVYVYEKRSERKRNGICRSPILMIAASFVVFPISIALK